MEYKPLDLSFLSHAYSPQQAQIRSTAQSIMANAGWSQPTQASLRDIAAAQKKAKQANDAAHKQTFLGGVFDLLSTPLYGVANALDEALAGHQSDSHDSVLEDVGKTIGGVFTGGAKGIGAGLRGATSILDVLPGVDINDNWQSDPTDKTHFSDVAIRQQLGMSTADAMKPENWAKIQPKLQELSKKSNWDKTIFELGIPDNLDDPKAREDYFRNQMLAGLPIDIGADPLNFVLPGIGAARKGAAATKTGEAVTEGLDAARASNESSPIVNGLKLKNASDSAYKPAFDAGHAPPIGSLPEGVTPGASARIGTVPADLSKVSTRAPNEFKDLANLGRRELSVLPKAGLKLSPHNQEELAKHITSLAIHGEKGWLYKAADLLRAHPGIDWSKTEGFLQKADEAVKGLGQGHHPGMVTALGKWIANDVKAAVEVAPTERRVMNFKGLADIGLKAGPQKLKRDEAILANKAVRKLEGELIGKRGAPGTGPNLARAIAEGRNVRYSGPQQARMWNEIGTNLKYTNDAKFDKAVRILRATENYFISKGVIPHSASRIVADTKKGIPGAVPLRLSDVAMALGPKRMADSHAYITGILAGSEKAMAHLKPDEVEALQHLRAKEAIAAAPATSKGLDAAKQAADQIAKAPLSVGRKASVINAGIKQIKEFTAAAGAGDVGAHVVGEYMGNLLGRKDIINGILGSHRLKTEAWLAKAGRPGARHFMVNDPAFAKSVTSAIMRASDLPSPAQLGKLAGPAARIADWLGARFNAAYGVQDMRQTFLIQQSSAMVTTARRTKLINDLGRMFPPSDVDLWHEAVRTAQANGIADGRVGELQQQFAKVMENLFGGSGLRSGAIADSTVVGRSRLLVDELNSNLKRFGLGKYQFAANKVTDATGRVHDFTKGTDWMRSWEAWDIKNPYEFLHKIQNAIQHTVAEKNMFDEIGARFASPKKFGDVRFGVDHPRLAGLYFTQEGASQAKTFVRMLDEASTPNSKSMQYFDHVLSKLKASMTIYIPGHHWTNLIGDMYYNWIAGVNKPQRYEQAMKVMLSQKGRYGDFAEIGKPNANSFEALTGPKALEQAMARSGLGADSGLKIPAAGNQVIVTMQNGTKVTADMIATAAHREGIMPLARVLEDVVSDVSSPLDKIGLPGKAHGTVQRGVHQISEIRDHIPRYAQFIDGIAKSKGSFADAVTTSARSVRKWHPDGLDLTKFEKQVMKRVFPFYSWTRKAIPLAIESVLFNGNKVMAYPRLMEAIGLIHGITPAQGTTDPFPADQMFPDWLRARGIGPISGAAGSYSVTNPSTPVLDILQQIGNPGQSSIDMMNPMAKVPLEVAQGQTLGRAQPIGNSNQAWLDYASKQIPAVSQIGRASGQLGTSAGTKAEGFPNWTNILNLLTGAKKVDTGKYQKSAQFDVRDYFKQKAQQQFR